MSSELEEIQRRLASYRDEHDALVKRRAVEAQENRYGSLSITESRIDALKPLIAEHELHERRLLDQEVAMSAAMQDRRLDRLEERQEFWFRRFHTSLALANGAGFAAIASQLFDAEAKQAVLWAAWLPMACFAFGMVLAGATPIALYKLQIRAAWILAGLSAGGFGIALVAALAAVWRGAGLSLLFAS